MVVLASQYADRPDCAYSCARALICAGDNLPSKISFAKPSRCWYWNRKLPSFLQVGICQVSPATATNRRILKVHVAQVVSHQSLPFGQCDLTVVVHLRSIANARLVQLDALLYHV